MITFESVGKTFKDGTTAVEDLSLVVPSGQITVIVGPSGCGKTTTLRMINRMIEPTRGQIVWDGTPIKSKRKTTLRRQMGYVIQSGGLFPHRTVVDNIGTVPGLLGWNKAKTRQRSMELLGNVGLDRKLADRYPAQLSGGQQQRVGVARALAADPLVLLMDEPFSAVDPVVRGELHEFFLGLQRELSKTIILITHDIDEAIKLGDQVAILRVGGRLAQAGTPQQLLEEPADAFVEGFVGRDRGYRSLSFLPASGLSLGSVAVVRDAGAAQSRPTLVVDGDAKPVGWADPSRPGQVVGLGATFDPESDTLRVALDAALTSPEGLAVAVSEAGRYAGVVDADAILAQVSDARTQATRERASAGEVRDLAPDSEGVGDHDADAHADAGFASGAGIGGAAATTATSTDDHPEPDHPEPDQPEPDQPEPDPAEETVSDDETATAVDEDAEATQDVVGETERQARIDEGDADPDAPTDDELTATPAEEPHEGLVEQPGGALAPAEGLPEEQQARDGTDAARDDDLR